MSEQVLRIILLASVLTQHTGCVHRAAQPGVTEAMDGPPTPANEGVDAVDIEPGIDAPGDHAGDGGAGGTGGSAACGSAGQPCCPGGSCAGVLSCNTTGFCIHRWAEWPMPNPRPPSGPDAGEADLPNPQTFETRVDGNGTAVVVDRVTGLTWQRDIDPTYYAEGDGQQRCAEMSSQGYAGFHDWRLPSRIELVSLVDFTRVNPAIDTSAFPSAPSDYFWSSSPVNSTTPYAWCVAFDFGDTFSARVSDMGRVRCVR
jgi:hypothetical protein